MNCLLSRWTFLQVLLFLALLPERRTDDRTKGYRNQSPVYKYTITDAFVVKVQDFMADSDLTGESTLVAEFPLPVEAVPGADAVLELIGSRLYNITVDGTNYPSDTLDINNTSASNTIKSGNVIANRRQDGNSAVVNSDDYYLINRHSTRGNTNSSGRDVSGSVSETTSVEGKNEKHGKVKNHNDNINNNDNNSNNNNNNHDKNQEAGNNLTMINSNGNDIVCGSNSNSSNGLCYELQHTSNIENDKGHDDISNNKTFASSSHDLNISSDFSSPGNNSPNVPTKNTNSKHETDTLYDETKGTPILNGKLGNIDKRNELNNSTTNTSPAFTENGSIIVTSNEKIHDITKTIERNGKTNVHFPNTKNTNTAIINETEDINTKTKPNIRSTGDDNTSNTNSRNPRDVNDKINKNLNRGRHGVVSIDSDQTSSDSNIALQLSPAMSSLESADSISGQAEPGLPSGFDTDQVKRVSHLVQQKLVAFLTGQKLLHSQNQTKNDTVAAQSTSGHVIELLFVVDYVLYVTFLQRNGLNAAATLLDIQTFYSQVLRATNERYATATSGSFSVTLTLSGIFVAQTAVASPWTELFKDAVGNVNPQVASPSFSSFALGLNLTFPHDLAVLFTGYNLLINAVTPSPGYTPVPGLLCSVIGVVWIQDTLDELTPRNLARFSAQSIGIQSDGVNGCSNDNLNVMSTSTLLPTTAALASNPWSFSSCSVTELATMLNNNALACTKQTTYLFPFNTAPFLGELFGQRYDADSQCTNSRRPVSRFCRELYFPPSTLTFDPDMCRNLLCQNGVSCVQTLAHDGTSCGNSKVCLRGQCVSSLLAPFRPVNCPQLDDPTITCTAASCFDATLRTIQCCGTCNGLVETSTALPFGVSTFFFQEEAFFDFDSAAVNDFE